MRITASISYQLFTYARNRAADWDKKLQNTLLSTFKGNRYTYYGKTNEPIAMELFRKKIEKGVLLKDLGLIINSSIPWMGFSPDGILCVDGEMSLLEIKCPDAGSKIDTDQDELLAKLSCLKKKADGKYGLKESHPYFGQMQTGMLLGNMKKAILIIYWKSKNDTVEINVDFDPKFCKSFITVLQKVYFTNLLPILFQQKENLLICTK